MSDLLDCGDSGCYFKKTQGGVRTNSGCKCFQNNGFNSRSVLTAAIEMLPQLLILKEQLKQKDTEIQELRSGHKGACLCCEPVGELNRRLEAALQKQQPHHNRFDK